jgi:hypothetical protein
MGVTMEVLEWLDAEPPTSARVKNAAEFAPLREQLKSQPGRWAHLLDTDDPKEARSAVMKARYEGFKFAFRKLDEDEYAVFGKFDPDDE